MLLILRYADELRKPEPYFDKIETKTDADAVKLATDLIEQESGKFATGEDAERVRPRRARASAGEDRAACARGGDRDAKGEKPKVINIMDALKKSMQAKGQAKVKDAVRKRDGKGRAEASDTAPIAALAKPSSRRTAH